MFRNYIITALRNFRRNAVFSAINITGLAIGISASLVIYLIVSYDFSFDKFEKDGDRVFRVVSDMKFPDNDFKNSGVPLPLISLAQKQVTGVDLFVPISTITFKVNIESPGKKPSIFKKQEKIAYINKNYFRLLSYQWLAGSPSNALNQPNSVVLTESRAHTYFPNEDASKNLGKTIIYDDTIKATVTGIVKDLEENTDFVLKEFISYSSLPPGQFTDAKQWGSVSSSDQLFIRLNNNSGTANITKQIQELFKQNQKDAYLNNIFSLQPLNDIHFNNYYDNFNDRVAHKPTLYGLLAVAAIILLLGCINFINLTTAQAVKRAKEIGIRKTMGSTKKQLVSQFLSETFLLTLTATIISIVLVPWILKLFSDFIPPGINATMLGKESVVVFIIILVISVSILSGIYPSLVLSAFNPVTVLKNSASSSHGQNRRLWIRKSLTVTQFVFAQAFIIAALVVGSQIRYMLNKELGFKKEGIITVDTPFDFKDLSDKGAASRSIKTRLVLLDDILKEPGVANACLAGSPPANSGTSMQTMKVNNGKKLVETTVEIKYAGEDFFKLYEMKLAAGRFVKNQDSLSEYVVNESYTKFLGFSKPADAIGKFIERDKGGIPIVGVVKDFYSQSLHSPVRPLAFASVGPMHSQLHIALKQGTAPGQWQQTIRSIEKKFKSIYPEEEFSYKFFDESIAKFYEQEQNTSRLLTWATGLAIIISCLGLLGLAIFTLNQRTKEIGIRKVLGASITQIVSLVSKDFLKLVMIAFLIAAPIAWYGMNKWLQNFAYHDNISGWLFVAGAVMMLLVAMITLGFQTIKAAAANPVKSLRSE